MKMSDLAKLALLLTVVTLGACKKDEGAAPAAPEAPAAAPADTTHSGEGH